MLYTSDSRTLAKLEVAVHTALYRIPKNYFLTIIEIPDTSILVYDVELLKGKEWISDPPVKFTQTEGSSFITANPGLFLRVPSAIVESDYNHLINPAHPDAKCITISDTVRFEFDMQLFK